MKKRSELYGIILIQKIKNRLSIMDAFSFKVVAVSISKEENGNPTNFVNDH